MINENKTLLEETHYYPFGLTMKGISTGASGNLHNKEKTFQNQQIDEELDLNWVQFKYRNHDPQIGRFIEIDPLSDKYVYNSTYAFSENRVINGVELEGLEVVLVNKIKDKTTYNVGVSNKDNRIIHVYAHGSQHSITDNRESADKGTRINTSAQFNSVLSNSGEKDKWEDRSESDPAIVVLHACRTGRPITKNGKVIETPIAAKFSKIKNAIIVAPDERDYFKDGFWGASEMGPYKNTNTDENGEYTKYIEEKNKPDSERSNEKGNWIMYINGKSVGTFNGNLPSLEEIEELYNKTINDKKERKK